MRDINTLSLCIRVLLSIPVVWLPYSVYGEFQANEKMHSTLYTLRYADSVSKYLPLSKLNYTEKYEVKGPKAGNSGR